MGTSSSKSGYSATTVRSQIAYLGDRFPFGDDEIERLARCHAYLEHVSKQPVDNESNDGDKHESKKKPQKATFLSDWAVFCPTLPKHAPDSESCQNLLHVDPDTISDRDDTSLMQIRKERVALMTAVEGQILPRDFGRRLECAVFLLPRDVASTQASSTDDDAGSDELGEHGTVTPTSTNTSSTELPGDHNDCESCVRRNKGAFDWIYRPCGIKPFGGKKGRSQILTKDGRIDGHPQADDDSLALERLEKFLEGISNCTRRGSKAALTALFKCCSQDQVHDEACAKELLTVAYRISLATAFINAATLMEDEVDFHPGQFIPEEMGNDLSQSLLDFAAKKRGTHSNSAIHNCSRNSSFSDDQTKDNCNNAPSSNNDGQTVNLKTFLEWADETAPCLSTCLPTLMHSLFFPDIPFPPTRTPFVYPDLRGQKSAFFGRTVVATATLEPDENGDGGGEHDIVSKSSPLLFTFGCMSPSLGGQWHRLYTSDSDGLSFNRLQNSLLGYGGPTLIVIREAQNGGIFGAFTASPWKETKDFYGNSDCFLYRLQPSTAVYRPRGADTNYMYCNSEARSKGYDGLAHGIGFGGSTDKPRLYISESFDGCLAASNDLTFEPGSLLPPPKEGESRSKYFEIEGLEVWGVGGDEVVAEGLGARLRQRAVAAANIDKARKVDKAQFLDDFNSGLIESKAFAHRAAVRGRVDCYIDEKDDKNYKYEK